MTKRPTTSLRRLGCLTVLALASAPALACAQYASELAAMAEAASAVRGRIEYLAPPADRLAARRRGQAALVERSNGERLESLLTGCGWPRRHAEGEQAAAQAWELASQSSFDLSVQRALVLALEVATFTGDAPPRQLAIAEDRVAVIEMRLQPYGTQLRFGGACHWDFYPLDDRNKVEERRKAVGLPPLDDYLRAMNDMVIHENCDPHNIGMPGYAS